MDLNKTMSLLGCILPMRNNTHNKRLNPYIWIYLVSISKKKDRITPHVTNFFRLRLTIEEQEGKRKYKSDGAVMVGEFVCMYVCSCTVSE